MPTLLPLLRLAKICNRMGAVLPHRLVRNPQQWDCHHYQAWHRQVMGGLYGKKASVRTENDGASRIIAPPFHSRHSTLSCHGHLYNPRPLGCHHVPVMLLLRLLKL
jgi:hypothetical protein